MRNCQSVIYPPNKDGIDVTSSEGTELAYETISCGNGAVRTVSAHECASVSDCYYSVNCRQVNNVFGCVALKSKNYCILNKQYTKEEYLELLPKIKKHMEEMPYIDQQGKVYRYGEFFPTEMSYCGYNQSQAFKYFPMTEDEARSRGYRWAPPKERNYSITMKSIDLEDSINSIDDSILDQIIQCEHKENNQHSFGCDVECAGAFRVTQQEINFYKLNHLPLPRLCFNCRHIDRIQWRNPPALYPRQCMCDKKHANHEGKCEEQFETSYAPDGFEIVYCEKCYQQEVI
ncbi:MAG: hypothetical protein WCK91_00240 [bacterium]